MPTNSEEMLIKEGWKKQATYDDPRLSEMVQMYEEIGLEVHLEPFYAENETGCTGCMQLMPDLFKTIYTRGKAEQGMTKDEGRRTKDEGRRTNGGIASLCLF